MGYVGNTSMAGSPSWAIKAFGFFLVMKQHLSRVYSPLKKIDYGFGHLK